MELVGKNELTGKLGFLTDKADISMGIAVVCIIVVMVMPIPPMIMDFFLTLSITISLLIMLIGMYILHPLELSAFPSILLLATIFRLSLNVASTRLILLHGNEGTAAAGKVIHAFGNFVVGGNYVVGVIVFLILVVINFVVITKGAGRIAEVAARFTLDAMPGKQMSIDADLNAGLITEAEANERRAIISQEAEYYGAMDGANKFVRGDAVAGIVITLINIVGGLAIGVLQNRMSFSEAAQNYTLLTVGDGLVTQIPALIVSTAAGIVVSRAGSKGSLGGEINLQVLQQPKAIAVASAVLFGFGLVPGMPAVPFFIFSGLTGALAYTIFRMKNEEPVEEKEVEEEKEEIQPYESVRSLPPVDILALEIGYGLIDLVDASSGGELLDQIRSIRQQFAKDIGVIIPSVHIQDNMHLKPGEYTISLKGNIVAKGEVMPGYYLAMKPGDNDDKLEGIPTQEPTYGMPAYWVKENMRETAMSGGYTVVDIATVIITHLSDVVRRQAHELIGRQEAQQMLDKLAESHPKAVEELVPNLLSLGSVVRVMQNLLKEQVPVRDLLTIVEALADWAPLTKDLETLTEYVRQSMARTITNLYTTPEGDLPLITLDQNIEKVMSESIQPSEYGSFLAIDPGIAQKIMNALAARAEQMVQMNNQPIVLCSARIRSQFKKLTERFISDLVVLSYDELLRDAKIKSVGTVEISDANQKI